MKGLIRPLPLYLSVGLSALVSILSIPLMISAGGLTEWSAIGIGQTVGGAVAPLVGLGWTVTGPHEVARARRVDLPTIYAESMTSRLVAMVPAIAIATAITAVIVESGRLPGALIGMLSAALVSADASFFYLGRGREWSVFLLTALPRIAGTAAGTAAIWLYPSLPILLVPAGALAGVVLGIALASAHVSRERARILREGADRPRQRRSVRSIARIQMPAAMFSIVGGAYLVAPTAVVRIVAPAALADFVFLDKLTKQATTFVSPAMSFLQGWVPRGETPPERDARLRRAAALSTVLTIVILLGMAMFGPWVIDLMSAGETEGTLLLALLIGVNIGLWVIDALVIRVYLVGLARMDVAARTALVGGISGVAATAAMGFAWGAAGALGGVAIGMAVRVSVALVLARRGSRTQALSSRGTTGDEE